MAAAGVLYFASTGEREAWERSCAGKQPFPSIAGAEAFQKYMHQGKLQERKDIPRGDWERLEPYWCKYCKFVHLGHIR